jgi:hypothetical protein
VCFSATADFVGSGILGTIGVLTLWEVRQRRELLLAAVPCLFALHQLTEGIVWLGLDHTLGPTVAHVAGIVYLFYAQVVLPVLLPLSVLLIEPTQGRRRRMLGFLALGIVLAVYMLWGLIAYPLEVSALDHGIVYLNEVTTTTPVAVLYIIATCGALFFSGFRDLVLLGSVNLVGLIVVVLVRRYEFTSIWCAYAAVVSVIIYFFFRRSQPAAAAEVHP